MDTQAQWYLGNNKTKINIEEQNYFWKDDFPEKAGYILKEVS